MSDSQQPYNLYHKSPIFHFNAIFYWIFAQLIMGGIIVDRLNNLMWGVFSYFDTRFPTPNEQSFINFVILPPYFCSDLSLLTFSYILLYCYYSDVSIFGDVMKFELNLFP